MYTCNNVLSKISPDVSDRCSLCQIEKETYDHLFWSCSKVHNAIVELKEFLVEYYYMDENIFTACSFLFSQFVRPVIVVITLLFKRFILNVKYSRTLSCKTVNFTAFLKVLYNYVKGDHLRALHVHQEGEFIRFWEALANHAILESLINP